MLFSPTLPAKTTQKLMLKRKMLGNGNANGKASGGQVILIPSIINAKHCKCQTILMPTIVNAKQF